MSDIGIGIGLFQTLPEQLKNIHFGQKLQGCLSLDLILTRDRNKIRNGHSDFSWN